MIDWEMLGICATKDLKTIKKAYASKVKQYHPEDDPEGFQKLREAYEKALKWAKQNTSVELQSFKRVDIDFQQQEEKGNEISYHRIEEDFQQQQEQKKSEKSYRRIEEVFQQQEQKKSVIHKFMENIQKLYRDTDKRDDRNEWNKLLQQDIIFNIETKQTLSDAVATFLQQGHRVKFEVLITLNEYFMWEQEIENLIYRFEFAKDQQKNIYYIRHMADKLYNKALRLQKAGSYKQAIEFYNKLDADYKYVDDLDIDIILASALYHKGFCIMLTQQIEQDNKVKQLEEVYYHLVSWYRNNDNEKVKQIVVNALFEKARYFEKQSLLNEAIEAYGQVEENYKQEKSQEIQYKVVLALNNKASCFMKKRDYGKAIQTYERLMEQFEECDNIEIKKILSSALYQEGICLLESCKKEDAVAVFDKLIEFCKVADDNEMNDLLIKSSSLKIVCMVELGSYNQALVAIEAFLDAFYDANKDCNDSEIQKCIAIVLYEQGKCFQKLKQQQAAIVSYNKLINLYSQSENIEIKKYVSRARNKMTKKHYSDMWKIIIAIIVVLIKLYSMFISN